MQEAWIKVQGIRIKDRGQDLKGIKYHAKKPGMYSSGIGEHGNT